GEGDMHVPTSLLGHPLGVAMEREDATELLERTGLALLADKWRLDREGADLLVEVVQVSPVEVVVRSVDFGDAFATYGTTYTLAVPVGAELRPR
ncbi:MAG: hypothetical protein WBQ50_03705, partial [Nocardioides sp.]